MTSATCRLPTSPSAAARGLRHAARSSRARARAGSAGPAGAGRAASQRARPPRARRPRRSPCAAAISARPSAPSIEVSTCEPWAPVGSAIEAVLALEEADPDRLLALWVARDGARERRRGARGVRRRALERRERGPREELEGDHRRYGVAGQAERERIAARAEPGGLAGTKAHAPEALLDAELAKRGLHVVVRADRHAAGDDHDVGLVERLARARARVLCGSSGTVARPTSSPPAPLTSAPRAKALEL